LSRAYAFGDFIKPEQMDAARGLAIARAGYAQHCGGTAYWLGRMYEEGGVARAAMPNACPPESKNPIAIDGLNA
jgi:hypothetical protein